LSCKNNFVNIYAYCTILTLLVYYSHVLPTLATVCFFSAYSTIIISGTYFVDRSSSTSRAILSNLKNNKTVLVILTYNTGE